MIAISLGDVTGIGPEVTLKALALDSSRSTFVIIGDEGCLTRLNHGLGIGLTWRPYSQTASEQPGIYLYNPLSTPLPEHLPPGSPVAAQAAVAWLKAGTELCLADKAQALVTAPVNKESIIRSGENSFVGQTEFLSGLARAQRTAMMLLGADDRNRWIRVVLATTHVPLRLVADQLTTAKVQLAIELAAQSCRDLRLPRQRVGVCGLNPHAGEGGKLGTEEKTVIDPAVASAKKKGLNVVGPLPADSLFYHAFKGEFDVVVAMYHDQGLGPLKMIGFEQGVNWTLGLPFIRTSPDHGTAYDIAGQGVASPSSMQAAINLARQLIRSPAQP